MKGLVSATASRAWLAVALVGFVVVVLVLALSLIPRLGAGQRVIDAAAPAFTNERVAGTSAGISLVSQYVDVAGPLLTARGGASKEVRSLIRLMRRKMALSNARARKILRREAPHTEALTRALPLAGVADEIPRLTSYLATTMSMSEDEVAALLERDYPRISQMLTALPNVADGWYDVPGIEGLTRLKGDKPVRTVPGLRRYYHDDVVPLMVEHRQHFQDLAGAGGIGYIGPLLLVAGLALLAYGLLQARRAASAPPGRRSWSVVMAAGVLIVLLVGAAQYFPRLDGGQKLISDFEPVFAKGRVSGAANAIDTLHEAVLFGDPIATPGGLAADETPQLYGFVADRTGRSSSEVRAALARRVPRTVALLDAIPLTSVAGEVPHLVAYLTRALRMPRDRVVALLHRRMPGLAQSLLTLPAVTAGWNAIPGTERMRRLDGFVAVRTLPAFDDYLRQDLTPMLVAEREDFDSLASRWPPVDGLPPLLLALGLLMLLYGGVMMRVARRY